MAANVIDSHDYVRLMTDRAALVAWLQNLGVIATAISCAKCGEPMSLRPASWNRDGLVWRCRQGYYVNNVGRRARCFSRQSIRKNTFFEKSQLSLRDIFLFVNSWVLNHPTQQIMGFIHICKQTAADWNSYCREVVVNYRQTHEHPIGGPGMTVEIDESKFGRRKYHRGHHVEGQWVFGGVCRETGEFFLVLVEARNEDTLLPIIQRLILPGTTVISDGWRAYGRLGELEYLHMTVNHSVNFVDPHTGAHTNTIEGLWRHAKASMPQYRRVKAHYCGHLDKFTFVTRCKRLNLNPTVEFCRAAGSLYQPNGSEAFAPGVALSDSESDPASPSASESDSD